MNILIADDEKNIRAGIAKILSESLAGQTPEPAVILEAKNGEAALDLALREAPALLISDIRMPKMDGLELLRRLRAHREYEALPVIVLSGYDEFAYAQKALSLRAAAYVLKPIDRRELVDAALCALNLAPSPPAPAAASADLPPAPGFIDAALAWIDAHFAEDISMAQAANLADVSYSYFSEKFAVRTGTHFSEYVARLRIRRARELLDSGAWRVYEVASQCGFRDVKYFERLFKRLTGSSPHAWRGRAKPS